MPTVAKVQAANYQRETVAASLAEALELLGGLRNFIQPQDRVLIKPNMVEAMKADTAVTTHPEVLRAVIQALKALGVRDILVGDSPGYQTARKVAEVSGIMAVCLEENVELVDFERTFKVNNPAALLLKTTELCDIIQNVDKIISLAKMKTHSFTGITGAVKNLFGFVVGKSKAQFHFRMQKQRDFAKMLLDIHDIVRPALSIIDGIIAMEGAGPRNGTPLPCGVLIVSDNALAADLVMQQTMGFAPDGAPVSSLALELGKIPPLSQIKLVGSAQSLCLAFQQPNSFADTKEKLPTWFVDLAQKQLTARPVIKANCIACGRCQAHCPPQAITLGQIAQIDYRKCIRCYCCQEFCPADAIKLQDGWLLKICKYFA